MLKNSYQFTERVNLFSKDEEGNDIIIKENIKRKIKIYLEDIKYVQQVVNEKGNIKKSECVIFHADKGELIVIDNYNHVNKLVFGNTEDKITGFQLKNKDKYGKNIQPKRQ